MKAMKKMVTVLLMALLCLVCTCALADGYARGDKVDDFTVTLSDGSSFTLSEALKEKKAVLLNFWASWCSPCKLEMPAMNEAYRTLADDVAFVCLSVESTDTNDIIASLRSSMGLDVLPMGLDSDKLCAKFDNPSSSIPFTVVIDKNGVVCFSESGSIPDTNKFLSLMNVFTAEDYDEPQLVYSIPAVKPDAQAPSEDDMHKAIGAEGMTITNADDGIIWPFVLSQDGTYVYASNTKVKDSLAAFSVTVDAKAGEGVAFEYSVDAMAVRETFAVAVDENTVDLMGGHKDWTQNVVTFDTDGQHMVSFHFQRDIIIDGEMLAAIRNVRKVSAEEAQAILDAKDTGVKTLEGNTAEIEVVEGEFKEAAIDIGDEQAMIEKVLTEGSSLTLRIRVGQDVDIDHAYLCDGSDYVMLNDLEHDDEGYLYMPDITLTDNELSITPGRNISVYSSVLNLDDTTPLASFSFHLSEDMLTTYMENLHDLIKSMAPSEYEVPDFSWKWVDGSEKTSAEKDNTPSNLNPDGTANYTVLVTDKDGRGLEKAMVQVCTNETCQLYRTDADGMVRFTDAPYAYEVHILKAPDGYQKPSETYLLPKEGGSLIIELNAQ